ncbi:MAG: hypothetical protein ACKV0T_08315 [Planctomycetales bacterium]
MCPNPELLDKLHLLLLESECPAEIDRPNLTLAYAKQYETNAANALRRLKIEYRVEMDDVSL